MTPGLEWLHDADVLELRTSREGDAQPEVVLRVKCPQDLGYVDWEGRVLRIEMTGVALWQHFMVGIATRDSINWVNERVSPEFQAKIDRAVEIASAYPVKLSVVFHSGSLLEVWCRELAVVVED